MIELFVGVMGVPERQTHIEKMTVELAKQARVCQDAGLMVGAPFFAIDAMHDGVWATCRRVLNEGLASGATHVLVLQDDVWFCADFLRAVVAGQQHTPHSCPSTYYLSQKCVTEASAAGARWCVVPGSRRAMTGQANVYPVGFLRRMLDWIDAHESDPYASRTWKPCGDDERMCTYMQLHRVPLWVAVPNLVQHLQHEMGSTLGHSGPAEYRRARVYVGDDANALGLGWWGPVHHAK